MEGGKTSVGKRVCYHSGLLHKPRLCGGISRRTEPETFWDICAVPYLHIPRVFQKPLPVQRLSHQCTDLQRQCNYSKWFSFAINPAVQCTLILPPIYLTSHRVSLMSRVQQSSSLHVQDMPAALTSRARKLPIGVPSMLTVTVSLLLTFCCFQVTIHHVYYSTASVPLSPRPPTLLNPFERRRFSLELITPRALIGI